MNSTGRAIAISLVALALAAGIAAVAYNAGSHHAVQIPPNAQVVYMHPGFGFFPIFPLFFLILFFVFAVRGLFWRRRRGWGHHRCHYADHDMTQPPQQPTV